MSEIFSSLKVIPHSSYSKYISSHSTSKHPYHSSKYIHITTTLSIPNNTLNSTNFCPPKFRSAQLKQGSP